MEAGAIILAGGKSSRMGMNKALLKINHKTNIERVTNQLIPLFKKTILVTNDPEMYRFLGLTMVRDYFPGKGPLAGIHAGLVASPYEVNVIAACDMPFVTTELAADLVNNIHDYDAVVPVINGKQHPLFSVFRKGVVTEIEASIENDCLRMKDLLKRLNVLYLTEKDLQVHAGGMESLERIIFNMNHPSEYEDAKKWAEEERPERSK